MSQNKVVGRNAAIGLGLLCVILIAGLVGVMLHYNMQVNTLSNDKNALMNYKNQLEAWLAGNITQLQNQIQALNDYKNNLEAWLSGNQTQLMQMTLNFQSQIDELTIQIAQLQGQLDSLQSIVDLNEQRNILNQHTISQGPREQSIVVSFQANYAGYVQISLTSTTDTAYIALHYSYQGHLFSFVEWVSAFGEAYFCVLPSNVTIYIGNRDAFSGANHTITATYHY